MPDRTVRRSKYQNKSEKPIHYIDVMVAPRLSFGAWVDEFTTCHTNLYNLPIAKELMFSVATAQFCGGLQPFMDVCSVLEVFMKFKCCSKRCEMMCTLVWCSAQGWETTDGGLCPVEMPCVAENLQPRIYRSTLYSPTVMAVRNATLSEPHIECSGLCKARDAALNAKAKIRCISCNMFYLAVLICRIDSDFLGFHSTFLDSTECWLKDLTFTVGNVGFGFGMVSAINKQKNLIPHVFSAS